MEDARKRRRRTLEELLDGLLQDYEATIAQARDALEDVTRRRLLRQAETIANDMDRVQRQIDDLALDPMKDVPGVSAPNPAQVQLEIQSRLPEIDFEELERALRKILREHTDGGSAALLLFQRSASLGGQCCAARVRELLRRQTCPGCFSAIPPLWLGLGGRADIMGPLQKLGGSLGLDTSADDPAVLSERIVHKLCGSLQSGSIVMIEFHGWDYLTDALGLIQWLIEHFWRRLLERLAGVADKYIGVKVIVLLFVNASLPESLPPHLCCSIDQFKKDRLLEIPLTAWSKEEIRDWIAVHSGLNLPRAEVDRVASGIYQATREGLPDLVIPQLLNLCVPATTS